MERLFIIAYNSREWSTVAYIMNQWEAEYIEGYMDSSGTLYNQLIKHIPLKALKIMRRTCYFDAGLIDSRISYINNNGDINRKCVWASNKIQFIH